MLEGITRKPEFELFLEVIPNRNADTLEEVICRNVVEGSTIITDKWSGYLHLDTCEFLHQSINHSTNYVDPDDNEIHTQRIESRWSAFKRFMRTKGTNYKPHLDGYIIEYMYQKYNKKYIFAALINDVSIQYPFRNERLG